MKKSQMFPSSTPREYKKKVMIPAPELEWKKYAAQNLEQTDSESIEKTFFNLSTQEISNKCNVFMKSPNKLGFEIVYKNDDGSKLVGIFIFRVAKEIFYAPVIFINGVIKSADLLYRCKTKTFVPLNEDWCQFFMGLNTQKEGMAVDPSVRINMNNRADLISLIMPPRYMKTASIDKMTKEEKEEYNHLQEAWKDMQKSIPQNQTKEASILRKFIVEDGGYNAIGKLHQAAKDSYKFANALFMGSEMDNYAPDLNAIDEELLQKEAGNNKPDLAVYWDILNNPMIKEATSEQIKNDYIIEDNRKKASLDEITFAPDGVALNGVGEPGIYDVLMADGTMKNCLVAYDDCDMLSGHDTLSNYPPKTHLTPKLVVVELDNRNSKCIHPDQSCCGSHVRGDHTVYGNFLKNIEESGELKDSMESGKSYRVYSIREKALSDPIHIYRTEKSEGGLDEYYISDYSDKCILHNPDYDGPVDEDKVVGRFYKFVPIASEKNEYGSISHPREVNVGSHAAMDNIIYENGYKKASVSILNNGLDEFLIKRNNDESMVGPFNKLSSKLVLMNECDLTESQADDVMDETYTKKNCSFFYKSAQQLRWRQFPEFYQGFDTEFNVPSEDQNTMKYRVLSQGNRPYPLRHRIGDKVFHLGAPNSDDTDKNVGGVPDKGNSFNDDPKTEKMIETATPEQLYELSKTKGMDSLFEDGVIGQLVKTYDSVAMLDKYLPDLEKSLDRLGRIIFLQAWKPSDFIESYGSDDVEELTNKVNSSFKGLGELVLELLLKSKKVQQGNIPGSAPTV